MAGAKNDQYQRQKITSGKNKSKLSSKPQTSLRNAVHVMVQLYDKIIFPQNPETEMKKAGYLGFFPPAPQLKTG